MIELITLVLLGGAVLYHSLGIGLTGIALMSALTSAFFFIYFLSRKGFLFGLLIGMMLFLGALTMWQHEEKTPQAFFGLQSLTGEVQSVDRRLDKTNIVVHEKIFDQSVQVTIHAATEALPGDTVKASGAMQQPEDFITDTGRLFPYHDFLQSKGVAATIPLGNVAVISRGGFSLTRFATIARFYIAGLLAKYIAFPTDGLVSGMLVGYQGGVPQMVQDMFRTTGVLHVLVLSGENITLLAVFLSVILRSLPFKLRSFLTGTAMILVVLISGAGVAAVRAGIMGVIALSAGLVRRSYLPLRALTLSILFYFFTSPQTLFTDPGFHLSVLATIFMILVLPKAETLFGWLPKKYNIRELVMLAVCVPVFMLPYTMYFSGLEPLASPFANIMMALIVPFMMLGGAIILTVSWLGPVAQLLGMLVSFIGGLVLKILSALNTFPQLNTPPIAWWGVIASYGIFFSVVFRAEIRQFWRGLRNAFLPRTSSSEKESP